MDTRKIKKLIELVKSTGIGELEVTSGDETVRINCQTTVAPAAAPMQQHVVAAPAPIAAPAEPAPKLSVAAPAAEKTAHVDGHQVKSPMVGTVYLSSTPGSKPFVNVGDRVNIGDTLCLIEAMKMFNQIEADTAGVISARLIDNESPVEYDQPLFIIEADG